jgi:hypothetical protein
MHFLFIFLDGVGLGQNDPAVNPFAAAKTPILEKLLGGHKLVLETLTTNGSQVCQTNQATLVGLDARLGIDGVPQSASGQAAILTGINIPAVIGHHYGPKPNKQIREYLSENTLFHQLLEKGFRPTLLNAFPQSYFEAIRARRRLPGAIAMAALESGLRLKTTSDLFAGLALSADFTGIGWRNRLNIQGTPLLTFHEAGERLAELAREYDFSFFEYWISDYAGHRAGMVESIQIVEDFDTMLGGLINAWDTENGLIFITSDHGNLENNLTKKHTLNMVPGLIFGNVIQREIFSQSLSDLTDITPAVLSLFN